MHSVMEDGLEDYLAGSAGREQTARMEAHLTACAACREEVEAMRDMSRLFSVFRSVDPPAPAPGFYARVTRLVEQRQSPSFWTAILQPAFGKRIALASLLLMATLGTVLISRETGEYAIGPSPEMIMAVERDAPALMDRDQMLYTLVSHRQ